MPGREGGAVGAGVKDGRRRQGEGDLGRPHGVQELDEPAKRRRGGARKEETHRQAQAGSASASPGGTPVQGSFLDEEKHKLINRIFE